MEGRDLQPIAMVGVHAVGEEQLGDNLRFAANADLFRKLWAMVEQETNKGLVALFGGIAEGRGVVGKLGVGGEHGGGGDDVAVVGEDFEGAGGAVRSEEGDHLGVVVADGGREGVRGAFNGDVGMGAVSEEELDDSAVPIADGFVEGLAEGGDAFDAEVGVGSVVEKKLDDFDVAGGRGVAEGIAGAGVVGDVGRGTVGEGGIGGEESGNVGEIADVGSGTDVAFGAALAKVGDDFAGSRLSVSGDVAPAAEEIVAVRKLDGAGPVGARGVEAGAAGVQFVDDLELAGHGSPVDGKVAALVGGFEEGGFGVKELADSAKVAGADGDR